MAEAEKNKMVEVAIDVLRYLANESEEIGTREISKKFEISSTAAQRIITSLDNKNCVEFNENTRKYKLGLGIIQFAQGSIGKHDLIKVASPFMQNLLLQTGETICLNAMIDNKRVTIYQLESNQELRYITEVGRSYPIYVGASGKAILATVEDEERKDIVERNVEPNMQQTLINDLNVISQNGFAISYGERINGGVGIGTPLLINGLRFSLSLYAPNSRIDSEKTDLYVKKIKETATSIKQEYKQLNLIP